VLESQVSVPSVQTEGVSNAQGLAEKYSPRAHYFRDWWPMSRLMIIPAAGAGSRLGSSLPKVLALVNGRPMVDYLFGLYHEIVDVFILIVHPSFERLVRDHCAGKPFRIEIEKQHSPIGMLDAILIPQKLVTNHHPQTVWVTWCDQIAVHPETVRRLRTLSDEDPQASLIFPTVKKRESLHPSRAQYRRRHYCPFTPARELLEGKSPNATQRPRPG